MIRFGALAIACAAVTAGASQAQETELTASEMIAVCGGYAISVAPGEDVDAAIAPADFGKSTSIVSGRLSRLIGHGTVINMQADARVEITVPKAFERPTFEFQRMVSLVDAPGDFGLYEVVSRGDAGKFADDPAVQSFQQTGASDVYWYVPMQPLVANADLLKVSQRIEPHDFFGELVFVDVQLKNNENGQGFGDFVDQSIGSPMVAVVDGRVWTDFTLGEFDIRAPFEMSVSQVAYENRLFSALIHADPLPYAVQVTDVDDIEPSDETIACPFDT